MYFIKGKVLNFGSNFSEASSEVSNWKLVSIGWNKQQAIICISNDLMQWCLYTCLNKLICKIAHHAKLHNKCDSLLTMRLYIFYVFITFMGQIFDHILQWLKSSGVFIIKATSIMSSLKACHIDDFTWITFNCSVVAWMLWHLKSSPTWLYFQQLLHI